MNNLSIKSEIICYQNSKFEQLRLLDKISNDDIRKTLSVELNRKRVFKAGEGSGGSGSFLLSKAIQSKADVFITADFKYHEFFDAEQKLMICDIGHYESEQFTIDLLGDFLKEKFPKFAVHLTEISTNPVNYY